MCFEYSESTDRYSEPVRVRNPGLDLFHDIRERRGRQHLGDIEQAFRRSTDDNLLDMMVFDSLKQLSQDEVSRV